MTASFCLFILRWDTCEPDVFGYDGKMFMLFFYVSLNTNSNSGGKGMNCIHSRARIAHTSRIDTFDKQRRANHMHNCDTLDIGTFS